MRSRYKTQTGTEAFYDEAESQFSGVGTKANIPGSAGTSSVGETNPVVLNDSSPGAYTIEGGMTTANAELLGDGATSGFEQFAEMAFSIEKNTVEAKSKCI